MQEGIFVSLGLVLIISMATGELILMETDSSSEFSRSCLPGEFQCQDGQCIPLAVVCDHEPHCNGGEDEQQDCKCEFHCQSGRYSWRYGSRDTVYSCIKAASVCDGLKDCMDGEDEADCECTYSCDAGYMYKSPDESNRMTGCLTRVNVCDGLFDCVDGQDEENCPCDFQCHAAHGSQRCLSQRQVCDNWSDCDGGEDEENCPCEYACEKGTNYYYGRHYGNTYTSYGVQCIKLKYVCDKVPDCADGQDENGCNY